MRTKKPRVVHISSDTGLFGGKDRVLLWLLARLAERKLADPVFLCFRDDLVARKYRDAGLTVELIPMSGPFDPRAVPRLVGLLKQLGAQIVHTHDHKSHVLGRLAKPFVRTPVVSTLHGLLSDAKEIPRNRRLLYGLMVRATDSMTDQWIAVSKPLFQRLGEDRKDVTFIPNGVDPAMVMMDEGGPSLPDERGPVLLCLGRLSVEKGQDILLDAMAKVVTTFPDTVLWLAGEGPLESTLRSEASILKIENHIRFLGFREEVAPLLRHATALILPSRGEGTPISVLEAMSMEVPVIAATVGGVPNLLSEPEIGILVPPENPEALAEAIAGLLRSPEEARRLGRAGKAHVAANFSLDAMAEATAKVYRSCLDS